MTHSFCEEPVNIFLEVEFVGRKERGFGVGEIAGRAADGGYQKMLTWVSNLHHARQARSP